MNQQTAVSQPNAAVDLGSDIPRPGLAAVLQRRHLPMLDGLRAVAVMIVIVYHFDSSGPVPGDLGVSIFFVLSGFLITWLLLREVTETGGISLRAFYMRRTLRIFPAYYAYIIFSLVIDTVRHHPWSRTLTLSAFGYVVNYFNALHNHPTTSVAHAWSLAVEEQFYLFWPAAFLLAWITARRRGLRWLLLSLITVVAAWRCYLYIVRGVGSAYVYNAFDTRFDNLAVGCLLALIVDREATLRIARVIGGRAWMPVVTIVLLLFSRTGGTANYHYGVGFTIDAVLIAVLLVQLLELSTVAPWRWLNIPVIRFLGVLSYSLYLYHGWGLTAGHRLKSAPGIVQFCVGFAAALVLALCSYYIVERPFLALKRRWERVHAERHSALAVGT